MALFWFAATIELRIVTVPALRQTPPTGPGVPPPAAELFVTVVLVIVAVPLVQMPPQLLKPETVEVMQSTVRPPSAYAGAGNSDEAHGLGFGTKPSADGYEWSHAGALTGSTASWLIRNPDGTTIAIIINTLPDDYATFFGGLFPSLQRIAFDITDWPTTNLWA